MRCGSDAMTRSRVKSFRANMVLMSLRALATAVPTPVARVLMNFNTTALSRKGHPMPTDDDVIAGTALVQGDEAVRAVWRDLPILHRNMLSALNRPMTTLEIATHFDLPHTGIAREKMFSLAVLSLVAGIHTEAQHQIVWSRTARGSAVLAANGMNTVQIPHLGTIGQKLRA